MEHPVFNKNKIFIATIYISFFSIIGKVFSFGKDAVISAYYGLSNITDSYFIASN